MLVDTITKDMTQAMKEQNKLKLSVLRLLKSALQLEKINKNHDLSDEETISVIKKQVKMRKDSIDEFTKYNKVDEVNKLKQEIEYLQIYLPEEMTEEELDKIIDEVFKELKPTSMKDMGIVIKTVGAKTKGRADMSQVSSKVKQRLN